MKTIILHYHLFKNAGTSLDAAFKENFSEEKGEWVTKEFPANPTQNREQLKQWIIDNPQAKCFSSHTAIFPVPQIDGIKIIPVIFFRHPIDRIASAYSFEKKQGGDGFGPTLARNTDLKGYIETRLSFRPDRQCRDFHCHRLSTMYPAMSENNASLKAILELPFIGLVEKYSDSLSELEDILKQAGFSEISLNVERKNTSRSLDKTLDEKLSEIEGSLGKDLFANLEGANENDLLIWKEICKKFL
ncbi:hypothetical protein ACP3VW_03595 [Vibrio sp. DNB22_17_1]